MQWHELPDILRLLAALCLVIALMGGLALLLKKIGLPGQPGIAGKNRRLSIIEVLPLDTRRRMMLIQRDEKQHLVILGPNGETVVETDIPPSGNSDET